jgi:hypothetical protein
MELDLLHTILAAAAILIFWVGYQVRVWDSGDLQKLAATAVSEYLEDLQKASEAAENPGLQKINEDLRGLKIDVVALKASDGMRMESYSRLRDDISNLQGRVTELEEKKDPLGVITDKLVPIVEHLTKPA